MKRAIDGVIGHAIGDALGVPVEMRTRKELAIKPVTAMIGNGAHSMPAGSWSDDTSMEICIMQSYIDKKHFDYEDIMKNFAAWLYEGKYTPAGVTFGSGSTCRNAIARFVSGETSATESGIDNPNKNGNGALMRSFPIAYYAYSKKLETSEVLELVRVLTCLTHKNEINVLGCYIYVMLVLELLKGNDKFKAYKNVRQLDYSMFSNEARNAYARVLDDDIYRYPYAEISSSCYVVETLEASLWCVLVNSTYKNTLLAAVNMGLDTDSTAAVAGSMAGVIYGYDSIPEEWLNALQKREYLEDLANKFEAALIE